MSSRSFRLLSLCFILLCTAGCDQVTKHLARTQLGRDGSTIIAGGFLQFILAENPGAFLSLGASLPQTARTVLTVCVGVALTLLLAHIVRTPTMRMTLVLGLTLICAGGISNLLDRLLRDGLVTDFMILRLGPLRTGIFNFADFAIVMGTLLVAFSWFRQQRSSTQPPS